MQWGEIALGVFTVAASAFVAIAMVGIAIGYGLWMDDAFRNQRWGWFVLLVVVFFPTSLVVWAITRFINQRKLLAG